MRLVVSGSWQARPCTVAWEDGRVTTDPGELLPLLHLHAWLHREGLVPEDGQDIRAARAGLSHPLGVLDLARSLLDTIDGVEETLGALSAPPVPGRAPD